MSSSEGERSAVAATPDIAGVSGGSLLDDLPGGSLDRLRYDAEPIRLEVGEWLFHEGDQADCAYIVRSGRVEVISDGQIIRTARRGAVIGELALLTSGARTASVRAQRASHLWRLDRTEFQRLIMADPQFALALCRALGGKLAEHRSPVTRSVSWHRIAIVALDAGVSSDDVAARLTTELAPAGKATILRSGDFASDADHLAAIERAEAVSRWVVLSAGDRPGDRWPDTCLAEADRVIAVSRCHPTREWIQQAPVLRGCELLVLGRWVSNELLRMLEPVVVQTLADETAMRRCVALCARRLSGQAVGKLFSQGAGRGRSRTSESSRSSAPRASGSIGSAV
jgi:CRP-like cAMP-binding protein